ncbi:MAG: hypothetical protein HRU41_41575 [Saprospiraceae bacterium]|nr:hypothetical protein [Saprospiraceae bacterium]
MYSGNEKTVISQEDARTNIRETLLGRVMDFDSTYLSQRALEDLLKVEGAVGVRFYMGKVEDKGKTYKTLIAVAVDANEKDILAGGEVILGSLPCPIWCSGDGGDGLYP